MNPDEIEPVSPGPASPDLAAPSGRGAIPRTGQDPGSASNVVTAIAAAIISSSVSTHSVIITVIVTISVLIAALAPEVSGFAGQRIAKDLGAGFHGEAFPAAYLVDGTKGGLDVIRTIGGSRAVEPDAAAGQAVPAPGPDPHADFEAFLEHHYRDFLRALMAVGATTEDAHDAVHEVVLRMLERNTWRRLTTNPTAWVRKAALHTYYDQQQQRRLNGEVRRLPQTRESYVDDGLNVWENRQWVEQILGTLPPTQRAVLEMTIAEMKASEIADLLGKSPGTVRQNLAHARRRLRANLGTDYQIDPNAYPRKEDTA